MHELPAGALSGPAFSIQRTPGDYRVTHDMKTSEGGGLTRDPTWSDWSVRKRVSVIMISVGLLLLAIAVLASLRDASTDEDVERRLRSQAESPAYPLTEIQSVDGCELLKWYGITGACILSERAMRTAGETAWRDATLDTRFACLKKDNGKAEPAAMLYACLLRGGR